MLFRIDLEGKLAVPVRVVDANGNDVAGAELNFLQKNLGLPAEQWLAAPRTMHIAPGAEFLVTARVAEAGIEKVLNILLVADRTVTKDLNNNEVETVETAGVTAVLLLVNVDKIKVPVRVVDNNGNDVAAAQLRFLHDHLGVPMGEWITAPQTMELADGGLFKVQGRSAEGKANRDVHIWLKADHTATKNLKTDAFESKKTPGTTAVLFVLAPAGAGG